MANTNIDRDILLTETIDGREFAVRLLPSGKLHWTIDGNKTFDSLKKGYSNNMAQWKASVLNEQNKRNADWCADSYNALVDWQKANWDAAKAAKAARLAA